jgi:hypothetical protein
VNQTNPSAVAFWRTAIRKRGVKVAVERISGYAPNTVTFTAGVKAIVEKVTPDSAAPSRDGRGASEPGAITQDDRSAIMLAEDLCSARFPLPLKKGDRVVLPETCEAFDVTGIDPYELAIAGAIKLTLTGVS